MTADTKPLAEITARAIEILSRELGPADTLRFINQFTTGSGNYTAERDALPGTMTLDDIIVEIKESTPRDFA
ncbi:hypothetical protein [Paludisphaera sp.]|uniref:hypothetical protein n=1 Tax=Paludisphaera sp. TaxID=2017432 RepID=UPI00301DE99A